MKYRIKFFADFASSSQLKNIYEDVYETYKMNNYGYDKDIFITTNDDYTHGVIFNLATPKLRNGICKSNVIGLAQEPTVFIVQMMNENKLKYISNNVGKYFIGDNVLTQPFLEKYSYLLHNKPLSYIPIKTKRMSFIVSQKKDYWFGYGYRYKLLNAILNSYLPIDIYGRVCYNNIKDARMKGVFNNNEPYEDYEFHICIENFITGAYVSEKVINPLLTNTIPIYLGCRNIKEYFGDDVITMSGNIETDMILIKDIINNPEKYRRNIDIEKIKKKISFLDNLDSIFA